MPRRCEWNSCVQLCGTVERGTHLVHRCERESSDESEDKKRNSVEARTLSSIVTGCDVCECRVAIVPVQSLCRSPLDPLGSSPHPLPRQLLL